MLKIVESRDEENYAKKITGKNWYRGWKVLMTPKKLSKFYVSPHKECANVQ